VQGMGRYIPCIVLDTLDAISQMIFSATVDIDDYKNCMHIICTLLILKQIPIH
jgi:hypothetical protein